MSAKSTEGLGHGNVFSTPNAKEGLVSLSAMTRAADFLELAGPTFAWPDSRQRRILG